MYSLLSYAALAVLAAEPVMASGTISLPIERKHGTRGHLNTIQEASRLRRVESASLPNEFYYYSFTIGVGTPFQQAELLLDTGSSDLWLMDSSNPYCSISGYDCSGQVFDSSDSSTFVNESVPFSIQYGDYTEATGFLVRDTLDVAGANLTDATFALATSANSTPAVFGIGFDQGEANAIIYSNGNGTAFPTYKNVPHLLRDEGYIETVAYSLYLNDREGDAGTLLFGGVDHAKYEDELAIVPIYNYYWEYLTNPNQLRVNLQSITTADGCPIADFNIAVLLDSGTSYASLPDAIIRPMAEAMNYTFNSENQDYEGDCNITTIDNFILNFSGKEISVPASDLIDYLYSDSGSGYKYVDGKQQCFLTIDDSTGDTYDNILGDVFLRSAYITYDLQNYEIGLAQAKTNVTDTDIEVITSRIPGTSAASYSSNTTQTGYTTYDGGSCRLSASSTAPSSSTTSLEFSSASASVSASSSFLATSTAQATSTTLPSSTSGTTTGGFTTPSLSPTGSSGVSTESSTVLSQTSEPSQTNIVNSRATSTVNPESASLYRNGNIATTIVSVITTVCSEATSFTTNGQGYTATAGETLTITDCPCTVTTTTSESANPTESVGAAAAAVTVIETEYTTYCPSPTTITDNGQTFTVTAPTSLTITGTTTVPVANAPETIPTASAAPGTSESFTLLNPVSSTFAATIPVVSAETPVTLASRSTASLGAVPPESASLAASTSIGATALPVAATSESSVSLNYATSSELQSQPAPVIANAASHLMPPIAAVILLMV